MTGIGGIVGVNTEKESPKRESMKYSERKGRSGIDMLAGS